jgi:hypothetical protein
MSSQGTGIRNKIVYPRAMPAAFQRYFHSILRLYVTTNINITRISQDSSLTH